MSKDADYREYAAWKDWSEDRFLSCSPSEARYFEGELRGIELRGARVLEIGFGNGSFLAFAREQGASIAGTELLESSIARARSAGIEVFDCDLVDACSKAAGRFDVVVAFDVFEHLTVDELTGLLDRIAVLLRPGGHLVARFPNGQSPLGRVHQYGDSTHRTVLSAPILMQLLLGRPWTLERATNPFHVVDGSPLRKSAQLARRGAQWATEKLVNRIYGMDVTMSPNVVVRLRRVESPATPPAP